MSQTDTLLRWLVRERHLTGDTERAPRGERAS